MQIGEARICLRTFGTFAGEFPCRHYVVLLNADGNRSRVTGMGPKREGSGAFRYAQQEPESQAIASATSAAHGRRLSYCPVASRWARSHRTADERAALLSRLPGPAMNHEGCTETTQAGFGRIVPLKLTADGRTGRTGEMAATFINVVKSPSHQQSHF